jgi:ribosome-associated translation inhibitor RaiA
MDIIIQSLGFTIGEALDSFIKEKVSSLKGNKIVRANVTLYKGPEANVDSNYCEIRLEVPGNDPFVKKHSPHFEVAVNECVEVLSQMMNKTKDKMASRQADADIIQDTLLEAADDGEVELEDVVR